MRIFSFVYLVPSPVVLHLKTSPDSTAAAKAASRRLRAHARANGEQGALDLSSCPFRGSVEAA